MKPLSSETFMNGQNADKSDAVTAPLAKSRRVEVRGEGSMLKQVKQQE